MKQSELAPAARVEEINPTDRVRGTVVSIDNGSGLFVVKYDNGDYVAYQSDQAEGFKLIRELVIPTQAAGLVRQLHQQHGRTPPEDFDGRHLDSDAWAP